MWLVNLYNKLISSSDVQPQPQPQPLPEPPTPRKAQKIEEPEPRKEEPERSKARSPKKEPKPDRKLELRELTNVTTANTTAMVVPRPDEQLADTNLYHDHTEGSRKA